MTMVMGRPRAPYYSTFWGLRTKSRFETPSPLAALQAAIGARGLQHAEPDELRAELIPDVHGLRRRVFEIHPHLRDNMVGAATHPRRRVLVLGFPGTARRRLAALSFSGGRLRCRRSRRARIPRRPGHPG